MLHNFLIKFVLNLIHALILFPQEFTTHLHFSLAHHIYELIKCVAINNFSETLFFFLKILNYE